MHISVLMVHSVYIYHWCCHFIQLLLDYSFPMNIWFSYKLYNLEKGIFISVKVGFGVLCVPLMFPCHTAINGFHFIIPSLIHRQKSFLVGTWNDFPSICIMPKVDSKMNFNNHVTMEEADLSTCGSKSQLQSQQPFMVEFEN